MTDLGKGKCDTSAATGNYRQHKCLVFNYTGLGDCYRLRPADSIRSAALSGVGLNYCVHERPSRKPGGIGFASADGPVSLRAVTRCPHTVLACLESSSQVSLRYNYEEL